MACRQARLLAVLLVPGFLMLAVTGESYQARVLLGESLVGTCAVSACAGVLGKFRFFYKMHLRDHEIGHLTAKIQGCGFPFN